MSAISQKILWIGLALAIVLGLLWQLYPLSDAQNRFNRLPLVGEGFVGEDVPLSDFERSFFKDVNILKRVYRIGNQTFFVTALDGTRNRHVVHDPYYCFTGSGWDIVGKKNIQLQHGDAEEVTISRNSRDKVALFWFSNGVVEYRSPLRYWMEATLRRLTLGWSGQEPVLILIQPLDTTTDVDWKKVLGTFSPLINL